MHICIVHDCFSQLLITFFFNYCLPWITSLWIKWFFAFFSDNERIRNRYQFFNNYALWSSWRDFFFDVMICFLCILFCVYEDFIIANEGLQILNLYMLSAHGHWAFMEGSLLCHTKCNMEHLFLRSSTRNQDFHTCYWVSVTTWLNDWGLMQPLKVWPPIYNTFIAVLYMTNYFIYSWMYEKDIHFKIPEFYKFLWWTDMIVKG